MAYVSADRAASAAQRTTTPVGMYGAPVRPAPKKPVTVNPFTNLIEKAIQYTAPPKTQVKIGPRGVTIEDVAARAANRQPTYTQENVIPFLVGQPSPTAGQRYGGFKTDTEAKRQILGEAYNAKLVEQIANEEAARVAAAHEQKYLDIVNPESQAFKETLKGNRELAATPLNTLAWQMAKGPKPTAEDYYGANMARINAVRGTGDYTPQQLEEMYPGRTLTQSEANALEMINRPALQNLESNLKYDPRIADLEDLANIIRMAPLSDLAQKIAVERWGYDPGMAAGTFTMAEDLKYQNMLTDSILAQKMAENPAVNPNLTIAEMILMNEGTDALMNYQQQQMDYAMNGTPTQQLAAAQQQIEIEQAVYDQSVREKYGFDPKRVGDIDAQIVRELTLDPIFTKALDDARQEVNDGRDAFDVATEYAAKYLEDSNNDNVGAEALGEIIANFDISYFG